MTSQAKMNRTGKVIGVKILLVFFLGIALSIALFSSWRISLAQDVGSALEHALQYDVPDVCQTDAVAYWKLDEISGAPFVDAVGDNDLGCVNCPTPIAGRVNGGQLFASPQGVQAPHDASLNFGNGSFSVAAWVRFSAACTTAAPIVSKFSYTDSPNRGWWLGCDGGFIYFSLVDASGQYGDASGSIGVGDWVYLVGVWTPPDQIRLYMNGSLVQTNTQSYSGNFDTTAALTIGFDGNPYYLNGSVDEVALYNRALTPAEIARQYQAGLLNFGYDVDNWTVADGAWTAGASWYSGAAPAAGDYAIVRHNTNLTGATTAACVDVMPNATLDFGSHELTVDGAFHNDGTVRQTKAANTVDTLVEFLRVQNSGNTETKYRGAEVTPTSAGLGNVLVSIRAAANDCTDTASPPYADRCFVIAADVNNQPATLRLYAANPDELNGIPVGDLRPYRFASGWNALTTNLATGTLDGFAYAEATTPGFSDFLLGGPTAPTAVSLHTFAAAPNLAFGLLLLIGLLLAAPTAYLLRRQR